MHIRHNSPQYMQVFPFLHSIRNQYIIIYLHVPLISWGNVGLLDRKTSTECFDQCFALASASALLHCLLSWVSCNVLDGVSEATMPAPCLPVCQTFPDLGLDDLNTVHHYIIVIHCHIRVPTFSFHHFSTANLRRLVPRLYAFFVSLSHLYTRSSDSSLHAQVLQSLFIHYL